MATLRENFENVIKTLEMVYSSISSCSPSSTVKELNLVRKSDDHNSCFQWRELIERSVMMEEVNEGDDSGRDNLQNSKLFNIV